MMGIWYTLAVVDEDGSITGTKGAVLAPSRPVEVVDDLMAADVGQAVSFGNFPYVLPPDADDLKIVASYDPLQTRRFRRCPLALRPTHKVRTSRALWAWERVE